MYLTVEGNNMPTETTHHSDAQHYFAFSFVHNNISGSVYIGYPEQKVTVPRINAAKVAALMPADSVLVGLGYMGYMTNAEVNGLT